MVYVYNRIHVITRYKVKLNQLHLASHFCCTGRSKSLNRERMELRNQPTLVLAFVSFDGKIVSEIPALLLPPLQGAVQAALECLAFAQLIKPLTPIGHQRRNLNALWTSH